MSQTCHTCGSVLLWNNGQLLCARRDCGTENGTIAGRNDPRGQPPVDARGDLRGMRREEPSTAPGGGSRP